jgi:DNA-binding NarL/FixJ family response regulator
MAKLRIFIADDHPFVLEGLKAKVDAQADMEVVGQATDGRTAVQRVRELLPNVVVMDVSLPGLNGADSTREIKRICPQVRVIALTVHEDRVYLRQLLEAGASGYVVKRSAADDLIRAIQTVAAGGTYLDPAIGDKIVGGYIGRQPLKGQMPGQELSEREVEVVRLIARGFANKEIAGQLSLSVKTVETYRGRAMEKLGLNSRADLVRYAAHQGWLSHD